MGYQKELDYMVHVLERMRLQVHQVHPDTPLDQLDDGLRVRLGMEADYERVYRVIAHWDRERTIYRVVDQFMCSYIYFQLPRAMQSTAVVIGPYLTVDPTRAMILEQAERLALPVQDIAQQADYYAALPVYNDPTAIMALVTSFGELLWGDAEGFEVVDLNYDHFADVPVPRTAEAPIEHKNILQQMKQMEERYAYENELMDIVSKGLTHRAEVMMSSVSQLNYQQRLPDPLRNMKNYCIICNTILRKAAERGGVHPLHLDRMSGNYARVIENSPDLGSCSELIGDMIRSYCRLVRTHASGQYSAIVQKALTYIETNLSDDLSLSRIAGQLGVTPGYLSAAFRREKGQTLTSYITDQRMKMAVQLLGTTRLQIQTIAQLCGCGDPNYFGKLFRKTYGMTPGAFRKTQGGEG